jgi:hypothetical protein
MWCWLTRLEGGCTSPEEQSEKREKLEETHTANEVRPRTKEWIGLGEAPIRATYIYIAAAFFRAEWSILARGAQ